MPIRVKEIFRSDLDPNSDYWWAADKLDKLNYNFGLLSLGGVPGPLGAQGNDGFTGERGFQGFEGNQGPFGPQGNVGMSGKSTWKRIYGENNDTLIPLFQGGSEYAAIPIVIGAQSDPGPNDYNNALGWSTSVATFYSKNSNVGNNPPVLRNNLSFETKTVKELEIGYRLNLIDANTTYVDFGKTLVNPALIGTLDVNVLLDQTNYNLRNRSNQNNLLSINTNSLNSHSSSSEFNGAQGITTNSLTYNSNAGIDQVLVSTNVDGDVIWKNQFEVFSALPEGSVISIRREDFNNINFHINDAGDLDEGATNDLHIIYGRGRVDGPFKGWYLANGKTWEFDNGVIEHLVPNLNSFDYNVDNGTPNTGEQGGVGGDDTTVVIGGGNASVNASYNSPTTNYSVDLILDPSDDVLELDSSTGSNATLHKNINIIKLNEKNLYWRTNPSGQIAYQSIVASAQANNANDACGFPTQNYFITNYTIGTWSDTNNSLTGSTLYTNVGGNPGAIATSNKWYASDGVARLWNGTQFTSVSVCPITTNLNLNYNLDVTSLNGTVVATGIYTIDGSDYVNATTLEDSNGNNAGSGWYKIANDPNGLRRYWNGSQFLGESISEEYVYNETNLELSHKSGSASCKNWNLINPDIVYYATDNPTVGPVPSSVLTKISQENGTVYVHKDWIGNTVGQFPLVKVYSQNRPGFTSPYITILEAGFGLNNPVYFASILTTSKLNNAFGCISSNSISGPVGIDPTDYNNGLSPTVDGTGGTIYVNSSNGATVTLTATNANESHWAIANVTITGQSTLNVSLQGDVGTSNATRTDTDQIILPQGTHTWTWDILNFTGSSLLNLTISQ